MCNSAATWHCRPGIAGEWVMPFANLILGVPARLRRLVARLGWRVGALYLCHPAVRAATGRRVDMPCFFLVQQPVPERLLLQVQLRGGASVGVASPTDPENQR